MAEKKDSKTDKKEVKVEKAPSRRILPPPEEKMKRGRGLVVLLFVVSIVISYVFSLMN